MFDKKDSKELQEQIRAAQHGDERAFEQLLTLLERSVYRLAFSMLRHKQDAEDATQEVFLKLWRTLGTWRDEASVKTYIMRIARNTVIDMIRRRNAHPTDSLTVEDDDGEESQLDIADTDTTSNPAADYARREQIEEVRRAIDELDADHRELIILRDINGLSYDEIAEATGLYPGTVKSRLSRAREKLKNILKTRNFF